jgi:hypothetical protein
MVFIEEDSGSVFDAPLNMVWKLGEAHIKKVTKFMLIQEIIRQILNETTFINRWGRRRQLC